MNKAHVSSPCSFRLESPRVASKKIRAYLIAGHSEIPFHIDFSYRSGKIATIYELIPRKFFEALRIPGLEGHLPTTRLLFLVICQWRIRVSVNSVSSHIVLLAIMRSQVFCWTARALPAATRDHGHVQFSWPILDKSI
jgi:hypothetical protein